MGGQEVGSNKLLEMHDFADAIADCQLIDPGCDGPKMTWERGAIAQRLDRVLIGEGWEAEFMSSRVTVLPRTVSDHSPILIRCGGNRPILCPPFRFQNTWVHHSGFRPEVDKLWNSESSDTGMRKLIGKMARVKEGLKIWNKNTFGDVFANVKAAEERAATAQINFEREASPANRETLHRLTVEYSLCLQMEEDYWRQKAAVKWAAHGERNTKFYQGWVKQRRIKNRIHEVKEGEVSMVEEGELKDSAIRFFSLLLSSEGDPMDELEPNLTQDMSTSLDCAALMKVHDILEV